MVLLHPIQDEVLAYGWAYGQNGTALQGKDLWLVATTGGPEASYPPEGYNRYFLDAFLPPYEQSAAICGMRFLPPMVLHGAHIVARARDVTHWNALRARGVMHVEREVFESSLRSARSVLDLLGQSAHAARQIAMRFRLHNLALFEQLYPHHKDRAKVIAVVKQGRLQLEEQMAQERETQTSGRPRGWGPKG